MLSLVSTKGARKIILNRFFSLRGTPPHTPPTLYPLNGKSFCQKYPKRKGGVPPPPPLNGKLPKIVLKKWVKKG